MITTPYVASLSASSSGTRPSFAGRVTSTTIAARKTIRDAMLPYATARALRIPSTIQRRLIASAGSTSANRGSTWRASAEFENSYVTTARMPAAAIDRARRSPRTASAISRKRCGSREISRTFSCSVPESTTRPNQPISAMPNVITPYGPGVSLRASQIWMATPISRAMPSPVASVMKLRRTPLRKDCPNSARLSRARKSLAATGSASTGGKEPSLLPGSTGLLDRLEVLGHVRFLAPEPFHRVVTPLAQLVPKGRVRAQALERRDELVGRPVDQPTAGLLHDLRERAEAVDDRRRPLRERLEDHDPEDLVADRPHDEGDRPRVERHELGRVDAAEEANVVETGRLPLQLGPVLALPDDEQVGLPVAPERLQKHLHTLQALEAAHEEEERALALRRLGGRDLREEVRQVPDRPREAALLVGPLREAARRQEQVDVACLALQQAGVAPQLRRALEGERTAQAMRLGARLAVRAEEHVHRADEPVLARRVELDPLAVAEHGRPSGERDVVEVHDVEMPTSEDAVELGAVEE